MTLNSKIVFSGATITSVVPLRFASHSDLPLSLVARFPEFRPDPLCALAERLNEESDEIYLIPNNGKSETLVLASPRLRLRCIGDATSRAITILSAEANELERWRRERKANYVLRLRARWSPSPELTDGPKELFALIDRYRARRAEGGEFWQYWSEYLEAEQARIDEVRTHPGWSYHERRWGLGTNESGCFDFRVDDDQEQILAKCDNRVLLSINTASAGVRVVPFQLLTPAGTRWITASPIERGIRIDQIPTSGRLQPDWKSLLTEYRRRRDALNMLVRGETALPELNQILPDGMQTAAEPVPFTPILPHRYNEEQRQAIETALIPGALSCILGPPGTGKTSVIAEIASQLAGRGKRVLISSQSNLAVDNALERVIDSDSVFRVRLGRPESVKLNPELLLDRASDRYRENALRRSEAALAEQTLVLQRTSELPESADFERILRRAEVIANARHRIASTTAAILEAQTQQTSVHSTLAAESKSLEAKSLASGFTSPDLQRLTEVMNTLQAKGWTPVRLQKSYSAIQRRITREPALQSLEKAVSHLETISARQRTASTRLNMLIVSIRGGKNSVEVLNEKRTASLALEDVQLELEHAKGEVSRAFAASGISTLDRAAIEQARVETDLAKYVQNAVGWQSFGRFLSSPKLLSAAQVVAKRTAELEQLTKSISARRATLAQLQADLAMAGERESLAPLRPLAAQLGMEEPPMHSEIRFERWIKQCRTTYSGLAKQKARARLVTEALGAYHARLGLPNADVQRAVLAEANVVAATCSGIAGAPDFSGDFDYVIVDEAGKASPLELLIPIVRGKAVVLVGDHKQLPPLLDHEITDALIAPDSSQCTLFERLFSGSHPSRQQSLRLQYRMVPVISDIVSELSYRDTPLEPAGKALERHHPFEKMAPIHWLRCEGQNNRADRIGHGIRNLAEAAAVAGMVQRMAHSLQQHPPAAPYTVGVISMYRQQAIEIERLLPKELFALDCLHLEIGTVDAFQGREKDAIIVSFVETDPRPARFFYDRRRLNVALSRARELLVLVGSLDKLRTRRGVRGHENPVLQLWELIQQSSVRQCATTEVYREQ